MADTPHVGILYEKTCCAYIKVDGNAYFVYRTNDGGFVECKDTDPAPYKTDYSLMPDLVKQTALASDNSGLLKLDAQIEKILRGEEATETTTETPAETTVPVETSDTESSTETYETTTPETTAMADETSETLLPNVTTEAPETVTELSESEATVPSTTDAITESSSETTTTTAARPEPETATVLFADRSGNIIEQKEIEIGKSIGALPMVPTVAGHTGKWTIDGEEISADYVVMGDVTVLAVYTANKYTVTFETKETGVDMPDDITAEYGAEITLPDVPTKTGYTGEWQIDGKAVTGKYTVTDDVTVTAVYTINEYTVTFTSETSGVTMPDDITAEYSAEITLPDVPTKTGYTGEWQIGGKAVSGEYTVTEDVTITAVYTIKQFTVTYECDEADPPEAETVEYGSPLTLPQMPEKTGYTGKWTIDGEEIPEDFEVTSDITVKFEYVINTYEITFECDDKTLTMPDQITAEYGTKLSEALADVEIPEKPWYNGKWTVDGADITADKLVEDDVIVTAEYTHIKVSISVDYVGGYSDGGDNDPANFGLYTSEDGSLDYDITIEELQSEIDVWIDSVSRNNNYVAGKVVYDNTDTSFDVLANPLEIDSLPEITADTKFSDIVYDYEYDGVYCSFVRIYLVPDWTVHKVTFHDVDGEEIESHYTTDYGSLKELPTVPDGYTWVYYDPNQTLSEFYAMQSSVNADTDVYCGVMVNTHGYANGGWNDSGASIYKKAGDTLTDEDLKNLCLYEVIAGFIDKPVNDASEITGFYSAGQVINNSLELYIVKSSFDYELADGTTGTLYLLNDSMLEDELKKLSNSPNNVWRFDNANGDIVSLDTLIQHKQYDENNASPHTSARFKIVEVAS